MNITRVNRWVESLVDWLDRKTTDLVMGWVVLGALAVVLLFLALLAIGLVLEALNG